MTIDTTRKTIANQQFPCTEYGASSDNSLPDKSISTDNSLDKCDNDKRDVPLPDSSIPELDEREGKKSSGTGALELISPDSPSAQIYRHKNSALMRNINSKEFASPEMARVIADAAEQIAEDEANVESMEGTPLMPMISTAHKCGSCCQFLRGPDHLEQHTQMTKKATAEIWGDQNLSIQPC